jgi:hypothetical protein
MPPVIARHQAFTQPVSAMRKNALQALCRHFGLDDIGPVTTLRQILKTHLQDNHAQLANNAIYTRLYPRGPGRQNLRPPIEHNEDRNSHRSHSPTPTPSIDDSWNGIPDAGIPDIDIDDAISVNPPSLPSRRPSPDIAARSPEPEEIPIPQFGQERHLSIPLSTYTFPFHTVSFPILHSNIGPS